MPIPACVTSLWTSLRTRFLAIPPAQGASHCRAALLWLLFASIITFPLGQAFREGGPLLSLVALALYYYWGWEQSALRKLPVRYLFVLFYALIFLSTLSSIAPATSARIVSPNLWKGFMLPFIAMESIRSWRDLRLLVIGFAIAAFYEGLDGIWQHITGFDFIHKTPIMAGRLTGSMDTYRAGDFMAMVTVPALGICTLLPARLSHRTRLVLACLMLLPALHLLIFAQSRSGYLGFLGGLYCLWVFLLGRPAIRWALLPPLAGVLLVFFGPRRISLEAALQDQRWDLWRLAWRVFESRPWFGAGAGAYNAGFKSLGLLPVAEDPAIQHPHNIYLQFLSDTGVVGFTIAIAFFATMTVWSALRIRSGLKDAAGDALCHWQLTAFFWAGWVCYLFNAIGAHDYYRTWWLALAMTLLGILLGGCMTGPNDTSTDKAHA